MPKMREEGECIDREQAAETRAGHTCTMYINVNHVNYCSLNPTPIVAIMKIIRE